MNRILQINNKIHEYKINNEAYTIIKWIIFDDFYCYIVVNIYCLLFTLLIVRTKEFYHLHKINYFVLYFQWL